MPRISITGAALSELRERMATFKSPSSVCIIGPLDDAAWSSENLEESWLLEKLYGPKPRWALHLMPLEVLGQKSHLPESYVHIEEVNGISVEVWTQEPMPRLSIELHGDAIRVCETDA
jgi:hypothetical protein